MIEPAYRIAAFIVTASLLASAHYWRTFDGEGPVGAGGEPVIRFDVKPVDFGGIRALGAGRRGPA